MLRPGAETMIRIAPAHKMLAGPFLALIGVFISAIPNVQAQNPPGRILVTPRNDIILQCNLDGSNCFFVTGAAQSSGDPGGGNQPGSGAYNVSVANNGIIAFQAFYGSDASCSGTVSSGCGSHVFVMNADGTNVRQITFNPPYNPPNFFYGGDFVASISPDGTMVAFVSNRNNAVDAHGTQSGASAVYVV